MKTKNPTFQQHAQEIATDELNHLRFLRAALGKRAVARPTIDLLDSFTIAARAAGVIGPSALFNPFADETGLLSAGDDQGITLNKANLVPADKNSIVLAPSTRP